MGILDDLRDEANQAQDTDKEELLKQEKLAHNYQMLVLPKMQQVYSYFRELLEYVSVIKKPIMVQNYSKRYKDLGELAQQNYKLSTDKYGGISDLNKLTDITLRFYCIGTDDEMPLTFDKKIEFDQEKKFLTRHKVPFSQTRSINGDITSLQLMVTRKIPVIFKFSVDYDNSRITLAICNHENFEIRNQSIDPEQIDDSFIDKLARFILRKDDSFLRMDIDKSYKENLRQQIELQKKAKQEELKQAELLEKLIQKTKEDKKIINVLKSFLSKKE